MTEQFQLKIGVNEAFLKRVREAEAAGLITNTSGLGKLALSHSMQHGQAATEALLRSNGHVSGPGQEPTELLADLAPIEQQIAAGISDVKRCISQSAAVIAGLLVLLAVGVAVYLRPPVTA
jgi:hypothetical protein